MNSDILIVVAALDEADRISRTLAALAVACPGAPIWVADDGSTDATPELARAAGATVVRSPRVIGKGQAMTAGVRAALASVVCSDGEARACAGARTGEARGAGSPAELTSEPIVLLCDGDLGDCARELGALVEAVRRGDADLTVAAFATRVGGGFGLALGFARWAVSRRCGLSTRAPISGQRAIRAGVLPDVLPFASGFGMEIGMTIDVVRSGRRVVEIDLPLAHRASGRTLAGFAHRGHQLLDFVRVYLRRARASAPSAGEQRFG